LQGDLDFGNVHRGNVRCRRLCCLRLLPRNIFRTALTDPLFLFLLICLPPQRCKRSCARCRCRCPQSRCSATPRNAASYPGVTPTRSPISARTSTCAAYWWAHTWAGTRRQRWRTIFTPSSVSSTRNFITR
jgi:hypothetical protein